MATTTSFPTTDSHIYEWGRLSDFVFGGTTYREMDAEGSSQFLRLYGTNLQIHCNTAGVTPNGITVYVDGVSVGSVTTPSSGDGYTEDVFAQAGITVDGWHDVIIRCGAGVAGLARLIEVDCYKVTASGTPAIDTHSQMVGLTARRIVNSTAFTTTGTFNYLGIDVDTSYSSPSAVASVPSGASGGTGGDSFIKFRGTLSEIWCWARGGSGNNYFAVWVDGVQFGQFIGETTTTGFYAIPATGFDNTTEHEYIVQGFIGIDEVAVKGSFSSTAVSAYSRNITWLGDSVTFGKYLEDSNGEVTASATSFAALVSQYLRANDYNTGIPGNNTQDMINRVAADVYPISADVIVVFSGYNDASAIPTLCDAGSISSAANVRGITAFTTLLNDLIANTTAKIVVIKPFEYSVNPTIWANLWTIRTTAIAACSDPTRITTIITDSLRNTPEGNGVHSSPLGYQGYLGNNTGTIQLTGLPTAGDTITIGKIGGGTFVVTFGTNCAIGGSVIATNNNLFTLLNSQHIAFENVFTGGFVTGGTTTLEYGVGVNAVSLATTSANVTVFTPIVSGFTDQIQPLLPPITGDITPTIEMTAGIYGSKTSGTFVLYELVTQATSGATGIFKANSTNSLILDELHGTPDATHNWVGAAGAIWAPTAAPVTSLRYARIQVQGFTTGATYAFGYSGNNIPGVNTPYFNVVSMGYDTTGTATTVIRKVYLTKTIRLEYPNQTSTDERSVGGNLVVKCALSDDVYLKDNVSGSGFAPTFNAPVGFVTNTGGSSQTSNVASVVATTNNSTHAYPQVISRWAIPAFQRVTGNFLVEASAYHRSAMNGQPVACVKFDCTDQHSNSAAQQVVTSMSLSTLDAQSATTNRVSVYAATIPVSALTQGDILSCRFRAYPWIGDSSSVADSNTGVTPPSELLSPLLMLNDKSNAGGFLTYATVTTTGNDSTGVSSPTQATADANPYLTIAGAAAGIKAYNNSNHSRNTVDGGQIYLGTGSYSNIGTFTGANTSAWCIIASHPTLGSKSGSIITGVSGLQETGGYWKWENLSLTSTTAFTILGNGSTVIWIDNCNINMTGSEDIGFCNLAHVTNNNVVALTQSFIPSGGDRCPYGLIRGNACTSTIHCDFYNILGNSNIDFLNGMGGIDSTQPYDNAIMAFNSCYGNSTEMTNDSPANITIGAAFVGNLIERVGSDTSPIMEISATSSAGAYSHLIWFHNTFAGQRVNNENDINGISGTFTNFTFNDWTNKFNAYNARGDHAADVRDMDGTIRGTDTWRYSYGHLGTWNEGISFIGDEEFWGLYCSSNNAGAAGYVNDQSQGGGNAGGGNYHPGVSSNLLNLVLSGMAVIPFDIAGTAIPNNGTGSAGALQNPPLLISGAALMAFFD